jgi:hypothetical protein
VKKRASPTLPAAWQLERFRNQPNQTAIATVTKVKYETVPQPHCALRCRIGDKNVQIICSVTDAQHFPHGTEIPVIYRSAKRDEYDLAGILDLNELKVLTLKA